MDKDLRSIARTYLGEAHFTALHVFFSEIWANPTGYRYRVFMARRCFNLNEIFMKIFSANGGQYNLKGMMSNHALLLQAEDVARRYMETGEIDSIVIVDDIIIHGRTIQKLLYDFEEAVEQELRRLGVDNDALYADLHRKLTDSVTIRVYLANKGKFLLDTDYFWKLRWESHVERSEWQEVSQRISWLIQHSEVANTSFVVSALGEAKPVPVSLEWRRVNWKLRERSEVFYFSRLSSKAFCGGEILLTVRSYLVSDVSGNARWLFVPFVFGGESHGVTLEELWTPLSISMRGVLRAQMGEENSLFMKNHIPNALKVQLMYLFFSAAILRRFFQDVYGGLPQNVEYDFEKTGRNFGAPEEISVLLKEILQNTSAAVYCEECMRVYFRGFPKEDLSWEQLKQAPDEWMMFFLNRDMENLIYGIGLNSERGAFQLTQEHRIFYPEDACNDTCSFDELFENPELRQYPLCFRLASVLMLADAGVGSLNPKDTDKQEKLMFRAGEQALFCKPRQYAAFIPALIMIENQYYQYGEKTVIDQVDRFQAYLKEHLSLNWDIFSSLGKLVEDMYSVGQQVNMWNINLLFSVELPPDSPEMSRIDQLRRVIREQEEIQSLCREYLALQHD